jgi:hypothetical protein
LVTRFHLRAPIAYSSLQGCVACDAADISEQADACAEVPMAFVTIKDLPQSDDLDREAMRSIVGGGLTGARPVQIDQAKAGSGRIVDYPPGFGRQGPIPAGLKRPAG